jgi:hypothetical protein
MEGKIAKIAKIANFFRVSPSQTDPPERTSADRFAPAWTLKRPFTHLVNQLL